MKHSLAMLIVLAILFSCKKEIEQHSGNGPSLSKIKIQLEDSIGESNFKQLDFNHALITNFKNSNLFLLRIPFVGKSITTDFMLLKIENDNLFSSGKIVHLEKDKTDTGLKNRLIFNGKILIYSLSYNVTTNSVIKNGFIQAFHAETNINAKPMVVPIPAETLREVVLVSYYSPIGTESSYSNLYNLQSIFNESSIYEGGSGGAATGGAYYNNSGTGGSYQNGNSPNEQNPVLIDFEASDQLAIDVNRYIKCFSNVPDKGAICTIKILADIPVDNDPTAFFDWNNGSPGHTFIQVTKQNGPQMVQQNIGFYPDANWKDVSTTAPTKGKFVDNAGHEFNASLIMALTPEKFQNTLIEIQYLARFVKYDLDEFNCTDFALKVFNDQRGGNQLTIPMFTIPGGTAVGGTATPQGLYLKLKEMKQQAGNPDANNITIPGVKGFAGKSNGPCN